MAGVFRIGVGRALAITGNKSLAHTKLVSEIQIVRCISGRALKVEDPDVRKPAPWPYKEKHYNMFHRFFDKTTDRFNENTKVIVVDGPIAAGKTMFAKELAEELEMQYFPEANLDMVYINNYGFDLRKLDPKLPVACRSFDVKDFCQDPKNRLTASFQIIMYTVRYSQYIDALAHLFSTGQGVVLDRSVYSDFVFLESMVHQGYISKPARSVYYEVKRNTISELMRPHLAIYLDIPVDMVQKRIKERKIPYEINSPALNPSYLTAMEKAYKQTYLKEISKHAELLVYDWSQGGDVEVVVEDIERINFDRFDKHDEKMEDWRLDDEEDWAIARNLYADKKDSLMCYLNVPRYDVPELITEADDSKEALDIINENAPGEQYEAGYNESAGDKGILFKMGVKKDNTLPLRERIISS